MWIQTVYDASYISFAPGADETKSNFSWYSPKTDVPGVIEYAKVTDGNPENSKNSYSNSSRSIFRIPSK